MDQPDEFSVEKILRARIKQGMPELLIKWEGFPSQADNTWEPLLNVLQCEEKIQEFDNELKEKQNQKRRERNRRSAERYRQLKLNKSQETHRRVVCLPRRCFSNNDSTCQIITRGGRKIVQDKEEMMPTLQPSIESRQIKNNQNSKCSPRDKNDVAEFVECKHCYQKIKNTHSSKRKHCAKHCVKLHPKKFWMQKILEDK